MPRRPLHDRDRPVTVCFNLDESAGTPRLCGPMVIKSSKVTQERIRISGSAVDVGRLIGQLQFGLMPEVPRGELFEVETPEGPEFYAIGDNRFFCLRHLRPAVDCGNDEWLCPGCIAEERLMWRTAGMMDQAPFQIDLAIDDDSD